MIKKLSLYFFITTLAGTLYYFTLAQSQEPPEGAGGKGFSLEKLYEETGNPSEDGLSIAELKYEPGDWEKYIVEPRYKFLLGQDDTDKVVRSDDINIITYGSANLNLSYGKSWFTKNKYRRFDTDKPVSKVVSSDFNTEQVSQLHAEGHVGRRLKLYIDHDSRKKDNTYIMQYRAVREDETIREINAGQVDIKLNKSKYAVYDDASTKGLGIDMTLRRGDLNIKAFGTVTRGETVVEKFKGNSTAASVAIREYQYVKRSFFQLEAFKRFDGMNSPPSGGTSYNTLITFSSNPVSPQNYIPYSVNIDSANFALYMDDQNSLNNTGAISLSLDNGYYTKLSMGNDYKINFTTGVIQVLTTVPPNARIFAVYTINSGSTSSSDPSARTDVQEFNGKIFVFIKYGYTTDEDVNQNLTLDAGEDQNGDGKLNLDIYELRSYYYIGEKQLLENNFSLKFYSNNSILTTAESQKLGKYKIDYTNGIISFRLREPFKELFSDATRKNILYNENLSASSYDSSLFSIKISYFKETRSFQLQHTNIIQNSVRIRVDKRELASSLYSVDYVSGYLEFNNPSNPVIGSETEIEIKYEYLPFASQTQAFVGGFRADYRLTRFLDIGGTFLYSRSSGTDIIPDVGSEPTQTVVLEGDTSLHLSSGKLKRLVNSLPRVHIREIPFELRGYAEYARSYKKYNSFDKALIDDMESSIEIVNVSLSDKDWILSSMPDSVAQTLRGRIYYKYYRNPSNPGSLKGSSFTPYVIGYAQKPGPYNIATGHIADSIQSIETQRSLVLDFKFEAGETRIPMVTRRLSSSAVDLSGLQYIELWYRGENMTGDVDLYIDVGTINEDSDGDGLFDTEDDNNNGLLDYDTDAVASEDKGYPFNGNRSTVIGRGPQLNSYTQGDGILNSEDLDGNGVLDSTERVLRLPGTLSKDSSPIRISAADPEWKMKRIYLNRNALSTTETNILKETVAVRVFLQNVAATTGKVYIDSLRFVSSRWRNIKIDDVIMEDPSKFSVTMVDSINDAEYRSDAFLFSQSEVYKSIHGDRSNDELLSEQETALQIDYNLANENGSITRTFGKAMDLRFYGSMNIWLNVRQSSVLNTISIRIGSSENDYKEYTFTESYRNVWRKKELKLNDSGSGTAPSLIEGNPDMKRIDYMEVIVNSSGAGTIWINDIYVSDAETLVDDAYWYEGEFIGKRALFYTASGIPVFSDLRVKYIAKGHGAQFSTVGKPSNDLSEHYRQLFTSMNVLPNWSTRFDVLTEKTETDSLNEEVDDSQRGKSEKNTIYFESDYVSNIAGVPCMKLIYKNDYYDNQRVDYIDTTEINEETKSRTHSPSMIIKEELKELLGGKFTATLAMDMTFEEEKVKRKSGSLSQTELGNYLSPEEKEKNQKENMELNIHYQGKYLYVQPILNLGRQEIVEYKGKEDSTTILYDVSGDYILPFADGDDIKFIQRNQQAKLNAGLKNVGMASAALSYEFYYFENNFRDYDDSERLLSANYNRAKSASSYISNGISIPLNFMKTRNLKFIKNFYISYTRSVLFKEDEIPFEGEHLSPFSENFGINRGFNGISEAGFNLFRFPPWYFFIGRGNYANGRDYVYENLNRKLDYQDGSVVDGYNNSFRLIDNYSLNTTFDFDSIVVTAGVGLNQVSERQNVEGIPQQVVTFSSNSSVSFDLMRIFSFGFFRTNTIGKPYHSASISMGYDYNENMLITSNIEEKSHLPNLGLTFKRDRSSVSTKFGVEIRKRKQKEYISFDDDERDEKDDIFIENIADSSFREFDYGYTYSILYETDVAWLYRLFSDLYKLVAFPIFSLEYSLLLNRYDYSNTTSPEPYDQHLITGRLTMDLHKNVQGGLTGKWALEKFRNRDTENVNREIMSYEIGLNFTLLF